MVKGHREGYTAASCHGYQRSSWLAYAMCFWACKNHPGAEKWPNTTCGERCILTVISSSFPFISSCWPVTPVLHHEKQQYSNPWLVKPLDHDMHIRHARLKPHISLKAEWKQRDRVTEIERTHLGDISNRVFNPEKKDWLCEYIHLLDGGVRKYWHTCGVDQSINFDFDGWSQVKTAWDSGCD